MEGIGDNFINIFEGMGILILLIFFLNLLKCFLIIPRDFIFAQEAHYYYIILSALAQVSLKSHTEDF